jgi:hypothetical protein
MLVLLIHSRQRSLLLRTAVRSGIFLYTPTEIIKPFFVDLDSGGGHAVLSFVESSACTIAVFSLHLWNASGR